MRRHPLRQDSTHGAQTCQSYNGRRGAWGRKAITEDEDLPFAEAAVLAVLYERGQRPSIDAVRHAAETSGTFGLSHDPGVDAGWAEALVTGLTFDLCGLAPGAGEAVPPIAHRFGLAEDWRGDLLEAVLVKPGAHLAGAAAMLPVVRACVALGAALAGQTGATAVVWIPARSAMTPDYFAATVADWQGGGAFPALGLTALVAGGFGMTSEGLAFFTGQEIEVCGDDLAHAGRIAVRLIHGLASHGPLLVPTDLTGPDGERLLAQPSDDGCKVRVSPRR